MSRASISEVDISAALDELLQDEEVFKELRDLPLQDGTSPETVGLSCASQELDSFDLSFLFADFTNGETLETPEGVWGMQSGDLCETQQELNSQQHGVAMSESQRQADAPIFDFPVETIGNLSKDAGCDLEEIMELCQGVMGVAATPITSPPNTISGEQQTHSCTNELQNESTTVTTLQACVQHDHPYAMTTRSPDSVVLERERMEMEGGSESGSAEENCSYDAGSWIL